MKLSSCYITNFLLQHSLIMTIYAFLSAFTCYFCVYAYRKPFTSCEFLDIKIWGIDYKIILITFQAVGYTISKFSGIKIISELNKEHRGKLILLSILFAEITLILFYLIPTPYNSIFMFLNGLPLGLIWGLAFSFVEGRKTSEILGCGMCISFIVASGVVKSVGKFITNFGISQFLMPSIVGAIFFPILILSVFFLNSLPPPTEEDVKSRTERVKMNHSDRIRLLKEFWPGILSMTVFYMVLTAYRDFRDNFAAELWSAFGYKGAPSVFAISEVIVAILVVVPIALFMLIKTNIRILISYHILIIFSMILPALSAYLYDHKYIRSGLGMMIVTGIGLYLSYVPFNSILFDLILSTFEYKANSGFLMYICDSFGYLMSVLVLFLKNFGTPNLSWLSFFIKISYILGVLGFILMLISLIYFIVKYKKWSHHDNVSEPLIDQPFEDHSLELQPLN